RSHAPCRAPSGDSRRNTCPSAAKCRSRGLLRPGPCIKLTVPAAERQGKFSASRRRGVGEDHIGEGRSVLLDLGGPCATNLDKGGHRAGPPRGVLARRRGAEEAVRRYCFLPCQPGAEALQDIEERGVGRDGGRGLTSRGCGTPALASVTGARRR